MKIINSTPVFNPNNNGFIYLCVTEDGTNWVRSVAGSWSKVERPLDIDSVDADFNAYFKSNEEVLPETIKIENKGDEVVPVELVEKEKPVDDIISP